jgi:hypothetical protein
MGPGGFIDRQGEEYEIRHGDVVTRAQGLRHSQGRDRHVSFHPGTSVEAGDLLVAIASGDQLRVTHVEHTPPHRLGAVVKAYYEPEKKHMKPQPPRVSNVVNVGTMNQSAIQQGSEGATQTMTVGLTPEQRLTVDEIVKGILDAAATLEGEDKAEVTAQVETVQAQLKAPTPKPSIIKACLGTVKDVLQKVVTATAMAAVKTATAHGLQPLIDKITAFLGS